MHPSMQSLIAAIAAGVSAGLSRGLSGSISIAADRGTGTKSTKTTGY